MANREMRELTNQEWAKCHAIIHGASTCAGIIGAGLAQLPMADAVALAPVQIGMITALGKEVFGMYLSEAAAAGIQANLVAGMTGKAIANVLTSWIPGVGNAVNCVTAAGITEAMGWLAVEEFSRYA